jgi:hypothetical protein
MHHSTTQTFHISNYSYVLWELLLQNPEVLLSVFGSEDRLNLRFFVVMPSSSYFKMGHCRFPSTFNQFTDHNHSIDAV